MRAVDRAQLLRRLGLGAAAVSLPALERSADALAAADEGGGNFPSHPRWKFVFLSHLTTNPLFVPLQYGIQDACALVKCAYQWTGSARGDVSELLKAFNAAISAKSDGIAVSIIDEKAFNEPVDRALLAGIPVVAYNTDAPAGSGNRRLAYIGQDLYAAGVTTGKRIVKLVGRGEAALFIDSPASVGVNPRLDGAVAAVRSSGAPIHLMTVPTAGDPYEASAKINAFFLAHRRLRGMFAVDAASTVGVGQVMKKHGLRARGVRAGGYGVLPATLQLIEEGHLDFTVDEQPYLQGFIPVIQLFLTKLSGGLVAPSDTNTGLLFVTKANVKPYLTTKTRYEGSSSKQKYPIS